MRFIRAEGGNYSSLRGNETSGEIRKRSTKLSKVESSVYKIVIHDC